MAILSASQKIPATVEFITGIKSGEYGPYRSVLFMRSDVEGDAAKVWRSFQPNEVGVFSKGQEVLLIPTERKGKQTFDVELPLPPTTPSPTTVPLPPIPPTVTTPQGDTLSPATKRAIAGYVETLADMYAYCLKTASNKLPDADPLILSKAADSLFDAAVRKFQP